MKTKNTFSKLRNEKRLIQEKLCDSLKALELKDNEIMELNQKVLKLDNYNKVLNSKLLVELNRKRKIMKKLKLANQAKDSFYGYWIKELEKKSDSETRLKITIGLIVLMFSSILIFKGL